MSKEEGPRPRSASRLFSLKPKLESTRSMWVLCNTTLFSFSRCSSTPSHGATCGRKTWKISKGYSAIFLKRMVNLPNSMCNSIIYLELGTLPIDYEISKRQLMYLQRILQLNVNDPVRKVVDFQRSESEIIDGRQWASVDEVWHREDPRGDEEMIKKEYKNLVNRRVKSVAF